jgi:hypothetical protein
MSPDPTSTRPTQTFVVSREQFESVPRRRGVYIPSYGLYVLLIFCVRAIQAGTMSIPEPVMLGTDIAGAAALFVFLYHFVGTLKIMGYEPWMMLALGMIAVMPLPGALFVAYMDRRIATAWDQADPDRASYRRKPAKYE